MDPTQGRFLSRDPAGDEGGPNAYQYADGRPTEEMDSSGMLRNCGTWDVKFDRIVNGTFRWSGNTQAGVNVTVTFEANRNCCCCLQMKIVQMIQVKETNWLGYWYVVRDPKEIGVYNHSVHFDSEGWAVDSRGWSPWYEGGQVWRGCAAQITDRPRRTHEAIVSFRDYAICTDGPDKGVFFGETHWGFWIDHKGKVTEQVPAYTPDYEPDAAAFNNDPTVAAWNAKESNKIPTVRDCCDLPGEAKEGNGRGAGTARGGNGAGAGTARDGSGPGAGTAQGGNGAGAGRAR
jgi:hypothetical protein